MAHSTTVLSQILSLIPRHLFQKLEARHKTGRASRKFGFKEQFILHKSGFSNMVEGREFCADNKTYLFNHFQENRMTLTGLALHI